MIKGAIFSKSGKYRYQLWRIWDNSKPLVLYIGLNPSTADALKDDPTIRRLIDFSKRFGYGGFYIGNLYGLMTPKPEILFNSDSKIGKNNDSHLLEMYIKTKFIILMWGSKSKANCRIKEFFELFNLTFLFYCFGKCNDGSPIHPLFISKKTKLKLYDREKIQRG